MRGRAETLHVFDDAHRDVFDHAYLVTADSDQAATARMFSERFQAKKLTAVCPPGRAHSQHILRYATAKIAYEGALGAGGIPRIGHRGRSRRSASPARVCTSGLVGSPRSAPLTSPGPSLRSWVGVIAPPHRASHRADQVENVVLVP